MKIAFDFDGTLEFVKIQEIAQQKRKEGHEVWIVTSRWDKLNQDKYLVNGMKKSLRDKKVKQLDDIATKLNIPVHYTNMGWKGWFLETNLFDVLYDDNTVEKGYLTKCKFIDVKEILI